MAYVDLREETPPEGPGGDDDSVRPVHWRLLTTRDVETVDDALDVAERYAKRWKIEEVFRISNRRFAFGETERKGFDIEALRIGEEAPRNHLIFACLLAATVVMQMTAARDGGADGRELRPSVGPFDPEDQPLLEAIARDLEGRTERQKSPHPKASSSPPGSAPASADGPDTTASPVPLSSSADGPSSSRSSTAHTLPWGSKRTRMMCEFDSLRPLRRCPRGHPCGGTFSSGRTFPRWSPRQYPEAPGRRPAPPSERPDRLPCRPARGPAPPTRTAPGRCR